MRGQDLRTLAELKGTYVIDELLVDEKLFKQKRHQRTFILKLRGRFNVLVSNCTLLKTDFKKCIRKRRSM